MFICLDSLPQLPEEEGSIETDIYLYWAKDADLWDWGSPPECQASEEDTGRRGR